MRLGLDRGATVYQRPLASRSTTPTIGTLRPKTSQFRFSSVGHVHRGGSRRSTTPLGLLRARRG
jgi:hypothetical protein